ncbi:BgTH12-06671 [Blumeria graminis f. sp. triticale]|uniref:BgTH12-06671 n=1 Tax=Blumeria graminis f. sp. triticale TaxID=1689686 RepID=A0A9W4D448_BLUGR|nr:BgTH12-06671 [Blumeria graminis f. sp. triticale]
MADPIIEDGVPLTKDDMPQISSETTGSSLQTISASLPHPRRRSLRPGSTKEDTTRRFLEGKLLHISRRYVKKFQPAEDSNSSDVKGYVSMNEIAKDFAELIDIVWLSGTPSLQIPYLLNIAGAINTYLPAFQPAPVSTITLFSKLDHAFTSLLKGKDTVTGEILPGFSSGKKDGLSKTDKVRLKSLVDDTRLLTVNLIINSPLKSDIELETNKSLDIFGEHDIEVAMIYDQTIVQLGEIMEPGIFLDHPPSNH